MHVVFLCIKHFNTYHLCYESLETAVDRKKRKGCVRKPTETEALPLHVNKSDCIKEVVLFNSEHLDKVCADATLKNMFA